MSSIPPPPLANSFVIGTAVINTHLEVYMQCFGYCKTPMRLSGIVKILSRPENSYNHVEECVQDLIKMRITVRKKAN